MSTRTRFLAGLIGVVLTVTACVAAPPTPESHFGFRPGDDGQLIDYEQIVGYLKVLDAASPRSELREIGVSPLGRPMVAAFISSEQNLVERLARLELYAKDSYLAVLKDGKELPVSRSGHARLKELL
jgi:hypothetical protein